MLTVGSENRLFGADSLLESGKYPKTTFADVQRVFGKKFDADLVKRYQEENFVTNEFVSDERGVTAWKITRPKHGEDEAQEEILYSEEIVAMLLGYVRMLAEK